MRKMSQETYDKATKSVIEMLGTAGKNWKQPWQVRGNHNVVTRKLYRGTNSFLTEVAGFDSTFWGTYRQWRDKNSYVKKGEKATAIVFYEYVPWKNIDGTIRTKKNGEPKYYRLEKEYKIFNCEQTAGDWTPPEMVENQTFDHVDTYISNTGCKVKYGSDSAHYHTVNDDISMPDIEQFDSSEKYYSVYLHELIHWTGHKDRCNRKDKKFTTSSGGLSLYAFEELIAELGAIFLGLQLGFQTSPQPNNLKYLNNWLRELGQDNKLIFRASGYAQSAVNYCNELQKSVMTKKAA